MPGTEELIEVVVLGLEYPPARITRWDTLESALAALVSRVECLGTFGARGCVTVDGEVAAIAELRPDGVWLV